MACSQSFSVQRSFVFINRNNIILPFTERKPREIFHTYILSSILKLNENAN